MRVVNDRQEKTEPSELGFFTIAAYAILSAFGIATVILGPLPMILAHARLQDPWPKITALLGAVIALAVLEVPMPMVIAVFVFGLFISDRVWHETGFWSLARDTLLIAAAVGLAGAFLFARLDNVTLTHFWNTTVDSVMAQLQASLKVDRDFRWDVLRGMLFYEGPFFYLSGVLLSLWLSVGIAAHLNWFRVGHRYSAERLRGIRLPKWATLVFAALLIASFSGVTRVQQLSGGLFRLACCFMFIEGCVVLSMALAQKGASQRSKSLVYTIAVLVGFYALVGMGALSPWLFKKAFRKQNLEEQVV